MFTRNDIALLDIIIGYCTHILDTDDWLNSKIDNIT